MVGIGLTAPGAQLRTECSQGIWSPARSGLPRGCVAVEERCSGAVQSRSHPTGVAIHALPADGPDGSLEQHPEPQQYSELMLPAYASADDWRTFRALLIGYELRQSAAESQLVQDWIHKNRQLGHWAHQLTAPELGCLLVARHADVGSDSEQSVVLVCNHDREGGTGTSYGFYLNKPWRQRRACGANLRAGLAEAFTSRTLYHGGVVSSRHIHLVHTCPQVQGSNEILQGVYSGGLPHANALVNAGEVSLSRFKVLAGYMGWDAGQLQREVDEGKWWVVAASAPLVISFIQGGCPEETVGGEQEAMWHEVLNLAGVPVSDRPCPRLPPFM